MMGFIDQNLTDMSSKEAGISTNFILLGKLQIAPRSNCIFLQILCLIRLNRHWLCIMALDVSQSSNSVNSGDDRGPKIKVSEQVIVGHPGIWTGGHPPKLHPLGKSSLSAVFFHVNHISGTFMPCCCSRQGCFDCSYMFWFFFFPIWYRRFLLIGF